MVFTYIKIRIRLSKTRRLEKCCSNETHAISGMEDDFWAQSPCKSLYNPNTREVYEEPKKKKNSILHSYQEMNQLSPPFKIKEVVIHEASHLVVSIVLVAGS